MRKPAKKNVAEGRGHACPPLGELTCSESQAEDMFSAGESTGDERVYPAKPAASLHSSNDEYSRDRNRRQKGVIA